MAQIYLEEQDAVLFVPEITKAELLQVIENLTRSAETAANIIRGFDPEEASHFDNDAIQGRKILAKAEKDKS